jgi:arylformamidase
MPKNPNTFTRRNLLGGAAAFAGIVGTIGAGRFAFAQDSGATGGPLVWLDMDQAALDAAYDQRAYAPDMQSHIDRRSRRNADALARLAEPLNFSYGTRPIEKLDVHLSLQADRPAPINIFFHGGAWRASNARDHAWMAESIINAGAHCVIPDYSLIQDVGGDLAVLGDEVRRAVAWVYENAASFGGDPERIYITGHSAGGHLAGVVMTTDWKAQFGLPADFIAGGLITSGMFDLEPVRLSSRREYVTITDESEDDLSAQRHIDRLHTPLTLAYGTLETPEFQRQSRDFAAAIRAAGKPVELIVAEGRYHLEMAESLANPYGLLGRSILEQMGLV